MIPKSKSDGEKRGDQDRADDAKFYAIAEKIAKYPKGNDSVFCSTWQVYTNMQDDVSYTPTEGILSKNRNALRATIY